MFNATILRKGRTAQKTALLIYRLHSLSRKTAVYNFSFHNQYALKTYIQFLFYWVENFTYPNTVGRSFQRQVWVVILRWGQLVVPQYFFFFKFLGGVFFLNLLNSGRSRSCWDCSHPPSYRPPPTLSGPLHKNFENCSEFRFDFYLLDGCTDFWKFCPLRVPPLGSRWF